MNFVLGTDQHGLLLGTIHGKDIWDNMRAVGARRPMEEENYAAVKQVYDALGSPERVRYHWHAGDHDYPPAAQQAAVEWFQRWFAVPPEP